MAATTKHYANMISAAGIRPSVHRVAVLRHVDSSRNHPTADAIYRELSVELPSLSRATVYNALSALLDAGLVRVVDNATSDSKHFDSAIHPQHSHFICSRCGTIYDVEEVPPAPIRDSRFSVTSVTLIYHGLCDCCLKAGSRDDEIQSGN